MEGSFRERYRSGNTPWDIGQPDFNLIEVVTKHPIPSCKALDIGCGTGDNSIWLGQNGFQVTGTDTSDIALEKAKEKASKLTLNAISCLLIFSRTNLKALLSVLYLTEVVSTHSVLKRIEEHLPRMWLPIWGKPACG